MLVPGETIPPFLTSSYYTEPYHQNIKLKMDVVFHIYVMRAQLPEFRQTN